MHRRKAAISESPVRIDLTKAFTTEDVANLFESVEDDRTWKLVVSYAGEAYLLDFDEVQSRLPTRTSEKRLHSPTAEERLAEWQDESAEDERRLNEKSDLIYFSFEPYDQGHGYVGVNASRDRDFVHGVYQQLRENWPQPKDRLIGY